MTKLMTIRPEFVEFVPEELEYGVVYISMEYSVVAHLCCSGCGLKVVTPLHPSQWKLTFDGETVSLSPSVGNGELPCNSHYVIRNNQVRWAPPLTKAQTRATQAKDRKTAIQHFEPAVVVTTEEPAEPASVPIARPGFFRRLRARLTR